MPNCNFQSFWKLPSKQHSCSAASLSEKTHVDDTDTLHTIYPTHINTDSKMSFSHWMNDLRTQAPTQSMGHHRASLTSMASSWAETDMDSDSDSDEYGQFVPLDRKMNKTRKLVHHHPRTAPIAIPRTSVYERSHTEVSYDESPMEPCAMSCPPVDMEDEDLMLFGNLAYFQTQHLRAAELRSRQQSAECASSQSLDEDEHIFDMEL